jgi:hypothetical protein
MEVIERTNQNESTQFRGIESKFQYKVADKYFETPDKAFKHLSYVMHTMYNLFKSK